MYLETTWHTIGFSESSAPYSKNFTEVFTENLLEINESRSSNLQVRKQN